jgi:hypothetical protein
MRPSPGVIEDSSRSCRRIERHRDVAGGRELAQDRAIADDLRVMAMFAAVGILATSARDASRRRIELLRGGERPDTVTTSAGLPSATADDVLEASRCASL